jgi:hypothetical protein
VIQIYRPVGEMAIGTDTLTGVEFVDDRIRYGFLYQGKPVVFEEDPEAAFRALRIEGTTMTSVGLGSAGNVLYYTLAKVEAAYIPSGFLEHSWWTSERFVRTLTGVRLAGDGVDYDILDGGQPGVKHESEVVTLDRLRMSGVRIIGAELRDGRPYFALAEATS